MISYISTNAVKQKHLVSCENQSRHDRKPAKSCKTLITFGKFANVLKQVTACCTHLASRLPPMHSAFTLGRLNVLCRKTRNRFYVLRSSVPHGTSFAQSLGMQRPQNNFTAESKARKELPKNEIARTTSHRCNLQDACVGSKSDAGVVSAFSRAAYLTFQAAADKKHESSFKISSQTHAKCSAL